MGREDIPDWKVDVFFVLTITMQVEALFVTKHTNYQYVKGFFVSCMHIRRTSALA